jgi:hypothetical protein
VARLEDDAGHDDVQDECKSFSFGHMRRRRIHTDIGGLRSGGSSGLVDGDEVDLTGKGRTYRIRELTRELGGTRVYSTIM